MSGAAQARNPQGPARPDRLRFTRPETVSIYCAIPRRGVDFDATVSLTDKAIYEYIRNDEKTREVKDGFRNDDAAGYAEIAKALRISRRTVARRIRTLIDKGYVHAYERIERGRRVGTRYLLPYWSKMREQWKRDPNIATMQNGDPIVHGRGKKFMTREQARNWKIAGAIVTAAPAGDKATPLQLPARPPALDGQSSPLPRPPPSRPPDGEIEVIRVELKRWCEEAGIDDAWFLLAKARETDPETPPSAIADSIRVAAETRRKVDSRYPFTPGWFIPKMDGAARDWREKERKHRLAAEKQTKWDREHRINTIADFIRLVANPYPETPLVDLDWMREQIAAADPSERAEAEAILAEAKTRAAGGV